LIRELGSSVLEIIDAAVAIAFMDLINVIAESKMQL
jgi:hypothetical protein